MEFAILSGYWNTQRACGSVNGGWGGGKEIPGLYRGGWTGGPGTECGMLVGRYRSGEGEIFGCEGGGGGGYEGGPVDGEGGVICV